MSAYGDTIKAVKEHIVLIRTPRGSGTGFLLYRGTFIAIATAAHVINQANYWGEPIDIIHQQSGTQQRLFPNMRGIIADQNQDRRPPHGAIATSGASCRPRL